jgi:hypothetical protein
MDQKTFYYLRLHGLFKHIIARPVPHTLVSWRFLFPPNTPGMDLHRRVFFNAWVPLPRFFYGVIVVYSMLLWWGFWGWYFLVRSYGANADWVARDEHIPKRRQLTQLLRLVFARAVPPNFYYRYRLYAYPASQWWDFIYEHELPHWHRVLSTAGAGEESQRLISDKAWFAEHMNRRGIPVVETEALFKQAEVPDEKFVFGQRDLFFKPRSGSRSDGCFALKWCEANDSYRLEAGEIAISHRDGIMAWIRQHSESTAYLVQPLLRNHPLIAQALGTDRLVTIRIITAMKQMASTVVSANFEISAGSYTRWRIYPISIASGEVKQSRSFGQPRTAVDDKVPGLLVPQWSQVLSECRQAHEQCPDIVTIGWDMAITEQGSRLLEGNINWGTAAHQSLLGKPLLQGPLMDAYRKLNRGAICG